MTQLLYCERRRGFIHLKTGNRRVNTGESVGHLCRFCERSFNRRYNRDRLEKQGCHKRLEEEAIESNPTSFGRGKPNKIHEHSLSQDEYDDNVYDDVDKLKMKQKLKRKTLVIKMTIV